MESISQLVGDSLARHGIEPSLDHLRLEWSRWSCCQSSFDVLLAPAKAGLFALAEEIPVVDGENRRTLALLQISQTDDLGLTLGRLFLPGNPLRDKLENGKCFVRYAVIEDSEERAAAYKIFETWLNESTGTYRDVA